MWQFLKLLLTDFLSKVAKMSLLKVTSGLLLKFITFQVETAVDTFWPLLEKPEKLVYFLLQFLGLLGVTNTVVWHVLVTQLAPSAPS